MKKLLLLIGVLLSFNAHSQTCAFQFSLAGNNTVNFNASNAFPASSLTYEWDFGDGHSDTSAIVSHTYFTAGNYVACCRYYDASQQLVCTYCDSVHLGLSNCNISNQGNALTAVYYTPPAGGNILIQWTFGDGSTPLDGNPITHIYAQPGNYNVCVLQLDLSTGDTVCSACTIEQINPPPTSCNFTYSINPISNSTYIFTSGLSSSSAVTWIFGDGTSGTGNTVTHSYNFAGTFQVCMTGLDSIGVNCQTCQQISINVNPGNCVLSLTADPNDPFSFTAGGIPASQGDLLTWSYGDGSSDSATGQVMHRYLNAGTYQICMNESDAFGTIVCSQCTTFTTGSFSNCSFTYSYDSIPGEINIYSSGSPQSSFLINYGDGMQGTSFTHQYSVSGIYTVCVTETNPNGITCSSCQDIPINMNPPGNCYFTFSPNAASNNTYDFTAVPAYGNSTITWNFSDGSIASGINITKTFITPGTYTVCMSEGDSLGNLLCTSCQNITIQAPAGNCIINYIHQNPNTPGQGTFSINTSSAFSTVAWDFGDGTTDSGSSVAHTFPAAGVYLVCVTEYDPNGAVICNSCQSVNAGNAGCQASFTASSLGLTTYFVDLSPGVTAASTYSWDFGDGSAPSTTRFPQHVYPAPATYNVCLTISGGGCTDQFCSPVTVDTNVVVNPGNNCSAFFAIIQIATYEVTVVNLSSGLNLNFVWDFGDGLSDSVAYPSHYYTSTGSYNLCLTVSDGSGCSDNYCYTLIVDSLGNIFRTSASGFALNVIAPSQLNGINELTGSTPLVTFPNPVFSELTVSIPVITKSLKYYIIYSIEGAEILSGRLNNYSQKINVQNLSSGTYLLEVVLSDGEKSYQRIIRN